MKKKRLILFMMIVAAIVFVAAITAHADNESNYTYSVNNAVATITGYTGSNSTVNIPSSLDGYDVTAIGKEAFKGNTKIEEVIIPNTVQTMGAYCFQNCTKLKKLTLGSGITTWSKDWQTNAAFKGCTRLSSVTIKEGVTSIGPYAFEDCTLLKRIEMPSTIDSVGNGAFKNCELLQVAKVYGTIGENVFQDCTYLSNVTLNSNVTSIGNNAFTGCTSLIKVTLPSAMTYIGNEAFKDCTKLTGIAIPNKVSEVGYRAFANCNQLKSVVIGSGVTKWTTTWDDSEVFKNCINLSSLKISDGVAYIPEEAFSGCIKLTSVTIPKSVTSLDEGAFRDCVALKTVTFASGSQLTNIGNNVFDGCSVLNKADLPSKLESIGNYAFEGTKITKVTIPDNCEKIGYYAFSNCTAIKSVTLGECVTSWGEYWGVNAAFKDCTALSSLTIKEGVTAIGSSAFKGCIKLKTIKIPLTVTVVGNNAFENDTAITTVSIERGTIGEGAFAGCKKLSSLSLGKTTELGTSAFSGCVALSAVTLPDTIVTIGNSAFDSCTKLLQITIPDSVTTMGYYAFANCSKLVSVVIGNNITTWNTTWGKNEAFKNCTSLYQVKVKDGANSLGSYLFNNCTSLNRVYIPSSVITIGEKICDGCSKVTIYCKNGSTAYNYARENGYKYSTGTFSMKTVLVNPQITLSKTTYTYDGSAKKPGVTVKFKSTALKKNTHYKVSYSSNKNAGTAKVTITGTGSYIGSATKSFTIKPLSIAKAKVTVKKQTYTGAAKKPVPTVKLGKTTLKKGTQFTVSYKNNKNPGKATLTVKGKGNYTGSVSKKFTIQMPKVTKLKAAKRTTSSVKLSWKKCSGVTGYQVYQYNKSTKKYKLVKTIKGVSKTSYTVKNLGKSKKYQFKVRAYKKVGSTNKYGAYSSVLKTSTK